MNKQQVGVIGLAAMGKNLVLNIADNGYAVSFYNREPEKTKVILDNLIGESIIGQYNFGEFLNSQKQPQKVILMLKGEDAVGGMIEQLLLGYKHQAFRAW